MSGPMATYQPPPSDRLGEAVRAVLATARAGMVAKAAAARRQGKRHPGLKRLELVEPTRKRRAVFVPLAVWHELETLPDGLRSAVARLVEVAGSDAWQGSLPAAVPRLAHLVRYSATWVRRNLLPVLERLTEPAGDRLRVRGIERVFEQRRIARLSNAKGWAMRRLERLQRDRPLGEPAEERRAREAASLAEIEEFRRLDAELLAAQAAYYGEPGRGRHTPLEPPPPRAAVAVEPAPGFALEGSPTTAELEASREVWKRCRGVAEKKFGRPDLLRAVPRSVTRLLIRLQLDNRLTGYEVYVAVCAPSFLEGLVAQRAPP